MTNTLVIMESVQVDKKSTLVPHKEACKIVDVILYGVLER
jgi:hypothetical protein